MSKTIDSLVQSSIDSKKYTGVMLVKLYFSPIRRYCTAMQSVYWDEAGGGELEYEGLGNLAEISALGETNELAAQTIQLSVSGIPNDIITDIFSDEYIGNPVYIWYGTLDWETFAIEGGQSGPVLVFAGHMDHANFEFGETASVTLNATSRLADWERPRGGRFNQGYQKVYVDPTDTGFQYVQALQNKQISWGGRLFPTSTGTGGGGGVPDVPIKLP
jgi:hypothetical protein